MAVKISSHENVDQVIELSVSGEELEIKSGEMIFYVHDNQLMDLTHNSYEKSKESMAKICNFNNKEVELQRLIMMIKVLFICHCHILT